MDSDILIPSADVVLTPALEKMYAVRPTCFQHLNLRKGVYWHPVLGFRAQAVVMLEALADRAKDHRLKTAEKQALLDYVASEFAPVPNLEQSFAEGTIYLGRDDETEAMPSGDYPKGTRVTSSETTSYGTTYPAAEYETLADAHVALNSTDLVIIPVRATRAGRHANSPSVMGVASSNGVEIAALVSNMKTVLFEAGGGSDGPDDSFVRSFAGAYGRGQYGPTDAASRLGALSGVGVRRFLVYVDYERGVQTVLVGDLDWGSSNRWAKMVEQSIYAADLVGFGCKVECYPMQNQAISVTAEIALRDSNQISETTEIDNAVRKAARSYFDDRLDWNLWNRDALRVAISRAHPRILNCNSAVVNDVRTGFEIDDYLISNFSSTLPPHFLLASSAMKLTYVGPA